MRPMSLVSAVLVAASLSGPCAADDAGSGVSAPYTWRLQLRAVQLITSNDPQYATVKGKLYGELAAQWRLSPQWATELAVAAPQNFNVRDSSDSIKLMPITWTAKYNFAPAGPFRPYLGAGLGYTSMTLNTSDRQGSVQHPGGAASWTLQAGFDLFYSGSYFVSVDARYLGMLESGFYRINPVLFGIGIGAHY